MVFVTLQAGNNVDIVAATESESRYLLEEKKKSGLMGSGGIGFTIGSNMQRREVQDDATTHSQSLSTVGSTGDSVLIDPGHDKRTTTETFESKSTGLTVALSGAVGSALNSAISASQAAKESSDDRLKALNTTKAVLSGVQAVQGGVLANVSGDPNNGVGVSISLSTQKSKSVQRTESDTVSGSTLNAGNNLAITATGNNKGDGSGDIVVAGSQLKAGKDTTLDAANDVLLLGAANTQEMTGKNSSSGGGVGVSIGAGAGSAGGGGSAGISVFANVNAARGKENGTGTVWTETTLDSGGTTSIKTGRDLALTGAQVSGEKVVADVGRDLLMQSQQDVNDYDSKQTSVAAGGSFTFGSMTGSGYLSLSQDKMTSNYKSVQEQTGIFAGQGGFDLTVGSHTQLDGAVIASTATADKNSLDTGTLGFSDIHNEADFKTSHSGISLSGSGGGEGGGPLGSFGGDVFKGITAGGMLSAGGNSGHAEGTTRAAVGEGTITVRDTEKQQQDVAQLSRDTDNANGSIGQIFDKEKEQNRLAQAQLIGEIGGQALDIARTQGDINGLKEAKKSHPNLSADDLRKTDAYKKEMQKYGTGSDIQRGIQAATAALQGLAGGNMGQALTGAAAPYLAEQIHELTKNDPAAKAVAHAVLGAVTSYAAGNSALAGAAGAVTGELMAKLVMDELYPGKKVSELSETEKQTVSILGTLAAGLAGGVAGNSTTDAVAGGQAGKNAVENNLLGKALVEGCAIAAPCRSKVAEQLLEIGVKAGITGIIAKEIADKISAEELDHLITLKMTGNDDITSKYLGLLEGKYGPSNTGGDQIADSGPTNTGNNAGPIDPGSNHTGNNNGQVDTGPNHTGGNQTVDQLPNNTGNQSGTPDVGGTVYESSKLQEKADALMRGEDVRAGSVEEARAILDKIPTLRPGPGGDLMPGMLDRGNTYRGDLINVNDPLSPNIHDQGKHADQPHYNIDIRTIDANGTEIKKKPAIFIDN